MDKRRQQRLFLTLRRVALPVAIAVISATLAGAFVQLVPQFNRWEAGSVTDSQSVAKTARADDRISLIVIDNTTVNRLKLNGSTRALFAKYAELIRGLREAGAKVLVIDLLFDESMVGSELLTEALVNSKPLGVRTLRIYPKLRLKSTGTYSHSPEACEGIWGCPGRARSSFGSGTCKRRDCCC